MKQIFPNNLDMGIVTMYAQHFHADNSKIHCAIENALGLKTSFLFIHVCVQKEKTLNNGHHSQNREEREKEHWTGTWQKMQPLIQYPTFTCSTVSRFLSSDMTYTTLLASSSMVSPDPGSQDRCQYFSSTSLNWIMQRSDSQLMLLPHQVKSTRKSINLLIQNSSLKISLPLNRKFRRSCYILCLCTYV